MVAGCGRWIVVGLLAAMQGCGTEAAPATTDTVSNPSADAADAADVVAVAADTDPGAGDAAPELDAAEGGCAKSCEVFAGCYLDVAPDECVEHCEQADIAPQAAACIQNSDGCKALADCLGVASTVVTPFAAGPYGTEPTQTAGPFQVRTARGFYSFQDRWTGTDTYFFVVRSGGYSYTANMWKVDISAGVQASSDKMLTYEALVDGKIYTPKPSSQPNPAGSQPSIMRALRVVWWK